MKYRLMHENDGVDWYWIQRLKDRDWETVSGTMSHSAEDAKERLIQTMKTFETQHVVEEFEHD